MTVKQLLEFIEKHNIPLDAEVRYQRITDYYFDNGGWKSIKKEGYPFNNAVEFNKKIDSGYYDDKERFPLITGPLNKWSDSNLEKMKEEYVNADSCVKYPDDNNLYIDAHY